MTSFGLIVQSRRAAMEMSLNALSSRIGGSPGASFLSKIESGQVSPSRDVAERLADALAFPMEVVLNAAGHASEAQRASALESLRTMLTGESPILMQVPEYGVTGPTGRQRPRMMRQRENVRLTDLNDPADDPYVGEVIYSVDRKPANGLGVIVIQNGRLGAWTYHERSTPNGEWIENGLGEKVLSVARPKIEGIIIRVTRELDLE